MKTIHNYYHYGALFSSSIPQLAMCNEKEWLFFVLAPNVGVIYLFLPTLLLVSL